jgi:CHAD domain-containing protein
MSGPKIPIARPIDPGLPVGDEIRRVLRDELRLVVDACVAYPSWQVKARGIAVRRARKSLKRVRAILDLVRGAIAEEDHRSMRTEARDLGRLLSPLRDRDVVQALLKRLEKDATTTRRREAIRLAEAVLAAAQPELAVRDHRAEEIVVAEVGRRAAGFLERIETLNVADLGRRHVLDRVERSWRRARTRFHDGFIDGDTEWLHETRKRVIRLQLSLQPLISLHPIGMPKAIRRLKRVADALGDDHDLAVLADLVDMHAERFGDESIVDRIRREIERRRETLQRTALRRGLPVLERSPSKVRGRLRRWWTEAATPAAEDD